MNRNMKTVRPGAALALRTSLFHLLVGFGMAAASRDELQGVTT
jgi:hypothetical protein